MESSKQGRCYTLKGEIFQKKKKKKENRKENKFKKVAGVNVAKNQKRLSQKKKPRKTQWVVIFVVKNDELFPIMKKTSCKAANLHDKRGSLIPFKN